MFEVIKSDTFLNWLNSLKDIRAKAIVFTRIDRIASGNFGDAKSVGDGISEFRIPYGPGYRVYFKRTGAIVIILLCGGDKSTQKRDIANAKEIARKWKD